MKYKLEEIPFDKFNLLGLGKKDVLKLPSTTLMALLNGRKTELMAFKYKNAEKEVNFKGKLSFKKVDGNLELVLNPVKNKLKNDFQLSKEELEKLQNNLGVQSIEKEIKIKVDGKNIDKNVLIYLDKDINTLIAINPDTIKVPESINESVLTDKQNKEFKQGKEIRIGSDKFLFNPTNELGFSEQNESTKNILKFKGETYKYDKAAFLLDIALLASGLGTVFMLGHLMKVLDMDKEIYRAQTNKDINPKAAAFDKKLQEVFKEEFKEIKTDILQNSENKTEKVATGINGKLLNYGDAPYKDNKDNAKSFFIEIEMSNGQPKKIWSIDLKKAINESDVQKGQQIKLLHKGQEPVTIKIPIKDPKTNEPILDVKTNKPIGYLEKVTHKNVWEITPFAKIEHTQKKEHKMKI